MSNELRASGRYGTDRDGAARPDVQRARRGWIELDPEDARAHPQYGVYGWALILLASLFIGPSILLWQDVEIVFGPYDRPPLVWLQLGIDGLLLAVAWNACRFLGGERAEFYGWYTVAVLLALLSLASFVTFCLFDVQPFLRPGAPEPQVAGWLDSLAAAPSIVVSGAILRVAGLAVATIYVLRSRRLRITVAKRTLANDPFLRDGRLRARQHADVDGYPTEVAAP